MKKLILIFLSVLNFSCNTNSSSDRVNSELNKLRIENDSLKKIVQEIDNKYVFDSISIREVEDDSNTYKLNSVYKSRLYFVGFNSNPDTYVVKVDSSYNPIDTLQLRNGGYDYFSTLNQEQKDFTSYVNIENKYGKKFTAYTVSTIDVKETD